VSHVESVRKCFPVTQTPTKSTTKAANLKSFNVTEMAEKLSKIDLQIENLLLYLEGNITAAKQTNETIITLIDELLLDGSISSQLKTSLEELRSLLKKNSSTAAAPNTSTTAGARRKRQTDSTFKSTPCSDFSSYTKSLIDIIVYGVMHGLSLNYRFNQTLSSNLFLAPSSGNNQLLYLKLNMTRYVESLNSSVHTLNELNKARIQQFVSYKKLNRTVCAFNVGPCGE
jgi:hypothetical protein